VRRRNRQKKKTSVLARTPEEKCVSRWCRNRRARHSTYHRNAAGQLVKYVCLLKHCWKCRARQLKKKHPCTYVLNMLRHSARKRNLAFTITLAEFKAFCTETRYLELRGNRPGDLTIDRKDWNEGYHIWNIQVLTHAENSAQGADNTPRTDRGGDGVANTEPVEEDQPF